MVEARSERISAGCERRARPVGDRGLGTEKVHYLDADTLVSQVDKLGIAAYQEHFGFDSLNPMLISQYRVHFCKIKIFVKS